MTMIREAIARLRSAEDGATAVEYALMVALIAGVIIAAVFALGGAVSNSFTDCANAIEGNSAGSC